MPPKQRTSAKKTKKSRGAAAENVRTAASAVAKSGASDNNEPRIADPKAEQLALLATQGKLDAKKLAKLLPSIAEELRDGADAEEVANKLLASVTETGFFERTHKQVEPLSAEAIVGNLASILTNKMVGGEEGGDCATEFWDELHARMKRKYDAYRVPRNNETKRVRSIAMAAKDAFDELCGAWEDRITAEIYDGRPGAFRQACSMLDAPLSEFARFVNITIDDKIDLQKRKIAQNEMMRVMKDATVGIKKGYDFRTSVCWECGKSPSGLVDAQLRECSRCQTACYCSVECQRSAWKEGHKQKCSVLANELDMFEQMLDVVDDTHKIDDFHGLRLSFRIDYRLAVLPFEKPDAILAEKDLKHDLPNPNILAGPSLLIFYANLERIVKGEWWIYGNPKKFKRRPRREPSQEQMVFFFHIAQLLTYDVIPYADKCNIDLTSFYGTGANHPSLAFPTMELFSEMCGRMDATQFLEIYDWVSSIETGNRAEQKHLKTEAYGKFRKAVHKSKGSS